MTENTRHAQRSFDQCVVFGSLRSGTTMLRLMIDEHPRFVCPGESDFLLDYLRPTRGGGWVYDLEGLAADRGFRASGIRMPESEDARTAFASMLSELRGTSDGCLVLVLHRELKRLLELAPDIPVLHIVRDPRDVARSAIGMGWAGNVYFGAETWLVTEKEWDLVAPSLHDDQIFEFHYEALVKKPEDTLTKLCNFLGAEYDTAMLEFYSKSTYNSVDPSLAEQWRSKQTPRELGLIEPLFGELLIKRGYKKSGHNPINPSFLERVQLRIQHWIPVWRLRIHRYGLRDPLVVSFCRKIGVQKWARPAQMRIDAVTDRLVK